MFCRNCTEYNTRRNQLFSSGVSAGTKAEEKYGVRVRLVYSDQEPCSIVKLVVCDCRRLAGLVKKTTAMVPLACCHFREDEVHLL